jgi:hypothetical protein
MDGQAIDIDSLPAIPLLDENGETQMRRMEKDAACPGGGAGGPLSKPHAAVKPGTRKPTVVPRSTAAVWTTVTRGTTLFEALRRSAVTQLVWHDCETITRLMASTAG